ncbi:hypothetical protein OG2516_04803 [Oceanicola granulosus HTCC2516]|uniref:Exopolysaccharide synthesis, ExoD n=1 Tax=Oceanicola granulosus (strain ATCC BAA-861 / DSM 15982 / KCTC 12143 / HTCC2516) TaxID=314256 RepID=Q2CAA9_OCEGH|nr:exopolysaccharide biosynthesis protein [Oceanicola granulosus]EAR49609.1 hypothetical protein OG2516_04803 [Oceanicola granulosus HTCC2516]
MTDPSPDPAAPPALTSVRAVVDQLHRAADGETTRMREVVRSLGEASFVPVLMAPALAVVTPLSGIPLFSSVCGILIALVSAQMLFDRDHLWLPEWIMKRKISSERVRGAVEKMRKPADFLDSHSRERLSILVRRPFKWITQSACMICGLAMPLFELVPFTSSILGTAVVLFSLSLLVRDGLYALFAFVFVAGGGLLVWTILGG